MPYLLSGRLGAWVSWELGVKVGSWLSECHVCQVACCVMDSMPPLPDVIKLLDSHAMPCTCWSPGLCVSKLTDVTYHLCVMHANCRPLLCKLCDAQA